MSVEQSYYSLRSALARQAKEERRGEKPAFGAPSDNDYIRADLRINRMSNTELLKALIAHEEPSS